MLFKRNSVRLGLCRMYHGDHDFVDYRLSWQQKITRNHPIYECNIKKSSSCLDFKKVTFTVIMEFCGMEILHNCKLPDTTIQKGMSSWCG